MGVRVRVKLTSKTGSSIEANSLLNTGFETEGPEILIPIRIAEALDLWPELPDGTAVRAYETAGGTVRMATIEEGVKIQVIAGEGRPGSREPLVCSATISEVEREVLLSDRAIEELGIVIESSGRGLWRFKDEAELQESVEPQYW